MPASTTHQCMDVIHKCPERTTLTKEIRDAYTGAAQYSSGGKFGRGGRGNGRWKYTCTNCQMDNYTTEACGKRKHGENDTKTGDTSRTDQRTCYHCRLPGNFKTDTMHFKRARGQRVRVHIGTASTSVATS